MFCRRLSLLQQTDRQVHSFSTAAGPAAWVLVYSFSHLPPPLGPPGLSLLIAGVLLLDDDARAVAGKEEVPVPVLPLDGSISN